MSIEPLPAKVVAEIEMLDQVGLLARRAALISKGTPAALKDSDLQEIVLIHNLLRRRSSGPPQTKTKNKAPSSLLPTKERLESLL